MSSVLERYFPRLLGGVGPGSPSSTGIGSSIASSAQILDAQKRALHSECPPLKKRKLPQQGSKQPHSNPAVKLLTSSMDVLVVVGAVGANSNSGAAMEDGVGITNVSSGGDTIILDSGEEEKGESADDARWSP